MKSNKQPIIRLAGYLEKWEWKKLNEISMKVTEKNKDNLYSETLTNSAEFGIVSQRDFFEKDISNVKNLNGYYVVRPDDFVYNPRISSFAPVGPIKRNKLNRTGVMSPLYYVFRTSEIDNAFLERYFSSESWHLFMKLNGDSGARSDRFAIKDVVFGEMPIPFPSIEEQKEIGDFFYKLEEIITLHQQELDTLKQTKQGFLQKMFPKEGESVPEVRFPGFTEGWEKHKLEALAEFNPKSLIPPEFEYVDLGSVLGTELISHRTEKKETAPSRAQRLAEKGDVFFQTVRPYQRNNYLFDLPFDNYVFSTGYAQIRPHINSYFLLCSLQEEDFVAEVLDRCTGTSYPAINSKVLAQISINVPKLKEEQIQIGKFFKQLDELIALQEKELDALKQTKKAFLQKMFV